MLIRSALTEKDFINASFTLLYSRLSMKIYTGIIVFFLAISVVTVVLLPNANASQILVPVAMLLFVPLMTYFGSKRNYATNARISETIEYFFEKDDLVIKGESFDVRLTWDKIYKVTQTKNWVLIWQNRQIANAIPKKDIWDGQMEELKELLQDHKVKNNL